MGLSSRTNRQVNFFLKRIFLNNFLLSVDLICTEALSLARLHECCKTNIIIQGHGGKFLSSLFKMVINAKGPNFLSSCWRSSELKFEDFVADDHMKAFLEENVSKNVCFQNLEYTQ